jgi:hypothetical protein
MSAIPSSMRLEPKPEAINAYRRRCSTNATSSNPYPSRGTIKIPLDTAFPGSMLDTSQTELAFTLTVINSNPFVDFMNLPKCGANAFLKEFRLMVNGNAIEKNVRYGLAFEDAMNKMGINSEPYEMFRSNLWTPTDSRFHINMIKPSMVDSMGCPMYRASLFNDAQQRDQHFFGHANAPDPVGTISYTRYYDYTTTGPTQSQATASIYGGNASATNTVESQQVFSHGTKFGVCSGGYALSQAARFDPELHIVGSVFNTNLENILKEGQQYNRGNHTTYSPADWPFGQPGIAPEDPPLALSRWQDISRFYANVKNIPIGMFKKWTAPEGASAAYGQTCFNSNLASEFNSSASDQVARTEFRISTPLLSGILGLLTDKFFPDMLVAAGKMWIEFDLQPKEVALQLLMDPCRRIPGTIRDFLPYTGRLASQPRDIYLHRIDPPAIIATLGENPSEAAIDAAIMAAANVQNSFLGSQLVLPCDNVQNANAVARNSRLCYSEGACIGTAGFGKTFVYDRSGANYLAYGNNEHASTDPRSPYAQQTNGIVSNTGVPIPQYCFASTMWSKKDANVAPGAYVAETEACFGTYLPSAVAQVRRTQATTNCTAITTNYGAYDTDYEISNVILYTEQIIVPDEIASQLLLSARSGAISYHTSMIGATYNNAPTTTSQNLIMTVTGASVNNVTLVFQSNAQLSGTQAFAYNSFATYNPWTKLDFSAAATSTSDAADVGGLYTLTNPLYTTNSLGLNLFLKIGNELIPRQAINDIPSFLVETQKGMQTLSDYAIQLDMQTRIVPTWKTNDNTSYMQYDVLRDGFLACFVEAKALDDQTLTGNPYFTIVGSGGYNYKSAGGVVTNTQTYTPIAARRRGTDFVNVNTPLSAYNGVLNAFKPFEGNFRMCFNLATFETQTSARCGTPIVNNQLFLQGDQFHFMTHKVDGNQPTVSVTALYEQDAKVVFEQGGNCLVFM